MKNKKDESVEKQKKGKMLIVFVVMFLILSFSAGAGLYLVSSGNLSVIFHHTVEKKYVDLGEFKINLKDTDNDKDKEKSKKRYFSGKIYIGYDKNMRGYEDEFKKDGKLPIVKDVINSYLRDKSYEFLVDSSNTEKIKKEMVEKINSQLETCQIEDIRFGEYLLQ